MKTMNPIQNKHTEILLLAMIVALIALNMAAVTAYGG